MAGFYYGQLSKEKKAVYDMLAAGCDALAAVIRVPDRPEQLKETCE